MLVWNDNLSVNVLEIDNQHKELFNSINRFLEALERNADKEALEKLFAFLEKYILMNFAHEERIMNKYSIHDYPDSAKHRSAHAGFKRDFSEFKTEIIKDNVSEQLASEFRRWLTNWWSIHIVKMDKGLGDFIRRVILF